MINQIRQHTLKEPKSTDPFLDFGTYHTLVMAVAQHLGIDVAKKESAPVLRLIELDEDLPAYDEDADKVDGKMPYVDKKGTVLYYDPGTQTWKRDETQQKEVVCNPYKDKSYTEGDRIVALYLQQAGKFIPLPYPGIGGEAPEEVGGRLWVGSTPADAVNERLWYAPYSSGRIRLWDPVSRAWALCSISGAGTVSPFQTLKAKTSYEVFAYADADGRLALEVSEGTGINIYQGVLVKYQDPSRRWLGRAQTADGPFFASQPSSRLVLNYYNRVPLLVWASWYPVFDGSRRRSSIIRVPSPNVPYGGAYVHPPYHLHLNFRVRYNVLSNPSQRPTLVVSLNNDYTTLIKAETVRNDNGYALSTTLSGSWTSCAETRTFYDPSYPSLAGGDYLLSYSRALDLQQEQFEGESYPPSARGFDGILVA